MSYCNIRTRAVGKKARITDCALKFPPFCQMGGQCIMPLQSSVCVVQMSRRGQRSEAVAVQEAIGFHCRDLFSVEDYTFELRRVTFAFPEEGRGICYGRFKGLLVSYSAVISTSIWQSTNSQCTAEKLFSKRYFISCILTFLKVCYYNCGFYAAFIHHNL